MIELPIRDLSRNQQRRLQESKAFDALAEDLVAEEYQVNQFTDAEWYDAADDDTGTKYEVKSTSSVIGDKYPSVGRFRLWKAQHLSLAISEGSGQGTAWYAFVFLDESDGTIKIPASKADDSNADRERARRLERVGPFIEGPPAQAATERSSLKRRLPVPAAYRNPFRSVARRPCRKRLTPPHTNSVMMIGSSSFTL